MLSGELVRLHGLSSDTHKLTSQDQTVETTDHVAPGRAPDTEEKSSLI